MLQNYKTIKKFKWFFFQQLLTFRKNSSEYFWLYDKQEKLFKT